jgi:hypothetical protein
MGSIVNLWLCRVGFLALLASGCSSSDDAIIIMLTPSNGDEVWTIDVGRERLNFEGVVGNQLLVNRNGPCAGDGEDERVAFDAATGESVTRLFVEHSILLATDSTVVVALDDRVDGLDPLDGTVQWSLPIANAYAVAGGGTLILSATGALGPEEEQVVTAFDIETGAERWSHTFVGYIHRVSTSSAERVLFMHGDDLEALDAASGLTVWTTVIDGNFRISSNNDVLFVNGRTSATPAQLEALSLEDGAVLWKIPDEANPDFESLDSFAVDDEIVVTAEMLPDADRNNAVHWSARAAVTGEKLWQNDDGRRGDLVLAHDSVHVRLSQQHAVWSLDVETGALKWKLPIKEVTSTPGMIVGAEGIYVGGQTGKFDCPST